MLLRRLFTRWPLLVLLGALSGQTGMAWSEAQGQLPADQPGALAARLHQHRRDEAASKERAAKRFLLEPAGKTAKQDLYDVHHYRLELDLDPTAEWLTGTVLTGARVLSPSLDTVELHLDTDLTVSAVRVGNTPCLFTHQGGILTVTLDRAYTQDEDLAVSVDYAGDPGGLSFFWSRADGQPMIWTLSEPYGARSWWPCKDLNTDKADSLDVVVTVPAELTVASQGLLRSLTDNGDTRTFHWHSDYPIATYLVSLAIHPYVQWSDWYTPLDGGDPMPVQFFNYPSHLPDYIPSYSLTVPMLGTFALAFGEYPFLDEKYGHADCQIGGGMEHQTLTSIGFDFEDLISHELAHQWWGDMVTCADFGHIWLNEGFATWSEAYWAEQQYGRDAYLEYMDVASYFGPGTIFVEDPLTQPIFDGGLSYDKGSWVVHMLRGVLGDEDFFAGLALYRANHLYGSATTEDLQAALESVSGRDLEAFFQQWIYGEYFPVYALDWAPGPGMGEITITINQVQDNGPIFTMPVPLHIVTEHGPVDVTVENNQASQAFVVEVPGPVLGVALDPDHWILRQVADQVTEPSLDHGVLLVNGVHWGTYGTEISNAYEGQAFWGDTPIRFWDVFQEPEGGYPGILPAPLGHGAVPASVLGRFSTVIWVGNNHAGDLEHWKDTPILSYLESGGQVLLMTRLPYYFLGVDLFRYLGLDRSYDQVTLNNCVAQAGGLQDIPFTGVQSDIDVFDGNDQPDLTVLFKDTVSFAEPRITGAVATPLEGGTQRPDGGRFAVLCGRPYRMDSLALQKNVEVLLEQFLLEPYNQPVVPVPGEGGPAPLGAVRLGQPYPNPFNPRTVIPLELGTDTEVNLSIFDSRGRLVRTLVRERRPAGSYRILWQGLDSQGRLVPSGVYFAHLREGEGPGLTRRLTLLR